MDPKPTFVSISTGTIIRAICILLGLWFIYLVRDVVAILFVALILASAFDRWVDWLQRKYIPRAVGILFIYIIILSAFSLVISSLVPPLIAEIRGVAIDFPVYWDQLTASVLKVRSLSDQPAFLSGFQRLIESLEESLAATGQGVFSSLFSVFGGLISFIVVLVMTFYMTVSESWIKSSFRALLPDKYQPYVTHLLTRMQEKVGAWLQGQMILSLIIASIVYLGLSIIGVKYALILAVLAGLFEFIPYVGPIMSAIPAIFFGFTQSPFVALLVLIMYVVMQQMENHIIVPAVMRRAVGVHPILSITAMLMGAKLFGFVGILLAIPVVTAISVWVEDVVEERKES